jgi:thiamine-monophosphate kinase
VTIDLDAVPLSSEAQLFGTDRQARLRAATSGDDYALLFTAPESEADQVQAVSAACTRIGSFSAGSGLLIRDRNGVVPMPARLGFLHAR